NTLASRETATSDRWATLTLTGYQDGSSSNGHFQFGSVCLTCLSMSTSVLSVTSAETMQNIETKTETRQETKIPPEVNQGFAAATDYDTATNVNNTFGTTDMVALGSLGVLSSTKWSLVTIDSVHTTARLETATQSASWMQLGTFTLDTYVLPTV